MHKTPQHLRILLSLWLLIYAISTQAILVDRYPWAVMGYWGTQTNEDLLPVIFFQFTENAEKLYSIEMSYQLAQDNPLQIFFQPILSAVEVVGNFTYRDDPQGPIYEFDPYLAFRWADFPWNHFVMTSAAVGEGLSYDTRVPTVESTDPNEASKQLLNYLMFEVTFALPSYPQLEWVGRIHHRSGVFGLYGAKNSGSTAIGVGIRYRF